MRLGRTKATSDFREIPNRFDGRLGTDRLTGWKQNFAIGLEAASSNRFTAFGQIDMSLGNCNRGANIPVKEISKIGLQRRNLDSTTTTNSRNCNKDSFLIFELTIPS